VAFSCRFAVVDKISSDMACSRSPSAAAQLIVSQEGQSVEVTKEGRIDKDDLKAFHM